MATQPHRHLPNPLWACPINISGLDHGSVARFVQDDLSALLQPTLKAANDLKPPFQLLRKNGLLSYGQLQAVIESRTSNLMKFLRQVGLSIHARQDIHEISMPLEFMCLAGDSHNGGRRPVVLKNGKNLWVLKFADPRPYQLLSDILIELSAGVGIDLVPPQIVADQSNQWYFLPYLQHDARGDPNIEAFMYSMGALIAVAVCLRMVDLHHENLMISEGKPIIVDPECILYNFTPSEMQDRLLSTGLLSHDPGLSALRGGDTSQQRIIKIGLYEDASGILNYRRPTTSFHNRLHGSDGKPIDPSSHRRSLFGGLAVAFGWFLKNKSIVSDILKDRVAEDFRSRFLVRKTMLYITTINVLNLPAPGSYENWRDGVFGQFKRAGHFTKSVSPILLDAELEDMEARDVPYFWVNASEKVIRHHTGVKQNLDCHLNVREQAIQDILLLDHSDLRKQLNVLDSFLDASLAC